MNKPKDGGYCPRCDTVWASPGKCRCETIAIMDMVKDDDFSKLKCDAEPDSCYAREIWNAAIEAAAETITRLNREGPYQAITGATEIRKLKK